MNAVQRIVLEHILAACACDSEAISFRQPHQLCFDPALAALADQQGSRPFLTSTTCALLLEWSACPSVCLPDGFVVLEVQLQSCLCHC